MTGGDATFARVARAIARTFHLQDDSVISRATTSADVDGWDSLSHALLLMEIESEFSIDLPLERASQTRDVGELSDLVDAMVA